MRRDSTNNILFGIGAIGSLILVMTNAFNLYVLLFVLPFVPLTAWIIVIGSFLVIIGIIALYRETGNKLSLIAVILYFVLQVLAILIQLDILFPILLTVLDFATAYLMLNWLFWIFYLIIYLLFGYTIWTTREEIGIMATLTSIILMIWGVLNLVIQFIEYGLPPSILTQLWMGGIVIVWLFAFIYFIMALRS